MPWYWMGNMTNRCGFFLVLFVAREVDLQVVAVCEIVFPVDALAVIPDSFLGKYLLQNAEV